MSTQTKPALIAAPAQTEAKDKVVDIDAPPTLTITVKDSTGKEWGVLMADGKVFSTGSTGFHATGKLRNPANGLPYQVGMNLTLIGSK